jgi:hypothetical protein
MTELTWPDRWYFGGDAAADAPSAPRARPTLATSDPAVDAVDALFASVGDVPPPPDGADVSARAWLTGAGCDARQLAVAEACYANDFGASLDALGLTELITENRLWDSGDTYLVPDRPLSALVAHLAAGLPPGAVRTGWPVERVTVDGDAVALTGPAGAQLRARRVVVTVPLALLQRGRVAFHPPLPPAKAAALGRVRVGRAMKIVLTFAATVWPADFFDAVCPGCFVPEWWVTRYPAAAAAAAARGDEAESAAAPASPSSSSPPTPPPPHAITGFLCGAFADAALAAGPAATLAAAQAQLDAMFASPASPAPASAAFVHHHVANWDDEPWAGGGYSHPSLGAWAGDRASLAAPSHGGRVVWAGEATHPAVNPCLQAALDTGLRAAREVVEAEKRC